MSSCLHREDTPHDQTEDQRNHTYHPPMPKTASTPDPFAVERLAIHFAPVHNNRFIPRLLKRSSLNGRIESVVRDGLLFRKFLHQNHYRHA